MMGRGRFTDRVAAVVGGASGIGLASARRMASEGARVALVDINREAGEAAARVLGEEGCEALYVQADVTAEDQVRAAVGRVVEVWERIDALVNSAGVGRGGSVVDMEEPEWQRIVQLDLSSAYLTSRHAIPAMPASGGAIVHIASIGALRGGWGGAAFSAAKSGLIGLTRSMAGEHADAGIRVNCICPGVIDTPLVANWLSKPGVRESVIARHPLGRLGRAEDVAAAVAFLASGDAAFVTGTVLVVDGGATAT